jgi:membrane associated rhomboid family serine protease
MLIPYAIDASEQNRPTANRVIMGLCVAVFLGDVLDILPDSLLNALVLRGLHPAGLLGHMFLHAGIIHLLGNMLFLWVFGNAICATVGNVVYPLLFLAVGVCAALVHLAFDGGPAVGASGAINGITGLVVAISPLSHVYLLWIVPAGISRGRNLFEVPAWIVIIAWLLYDVLWMMVGEDTVAYWGHIGGFVTGAAVGLVCLHAGWGQVTDYDNRTLLDIIKSLTRGDTPASPRSHDVARRTQRRR